MVRNKKGAIEMSMQTIIIIVIGVTLLTLGLRFVYSIFKGVGGTPEKLGALSDKQLNDIFGESDEALYLPTDTIETDQGAPVSAYLYLRNPGSDSANFKYDVTVTDKPSESYSDERIQKWLVWNKGERTIRSGQGLKDRILIKVPPNAPLGTYFFSIELTCTPEDVCFGPYYANLVLEVK